MMKRTISIALRLLAGVGLVLPLADCKGERRAGGEDKQMKQTDAQYIQLAGNPQTSLPNRIKALKALPAEKDAALVAALKGLLGRQRPAGKPGVNFDPQGAERVVDLQAIAALHRAADDSEIGRIARLVAQGSRILKGADDEQRNAAAVIREVGRVEPIRDLTKLAAEGDANGATNAVLVLEQLKLPDSASMQPLGGIANLNEPVTFTIRTLKEEMETIARLSKGSVVLSSGVTAAITQKNYDRGEVKREKVKLADVLEKDLPMIGFDYFALEKTVTICTYPEAGQRWQGWWKKYGDLLIYDKKSETFMLRKTAAR